MSLEWTALHPAPTADAILALDTAHDWDSFRAAAARFDVPAQNMVYADVDGHIGYQAPGRIPVRQSGNDGYLPAEGWRADDDWTGDDIPFDGLPHVLDPDDGFIVTANQAVVGPDYPYYLTSDWDRGYRSQRIRDLLEEEGELSVDEMADIQLDARSPIAPALVPRLLDVQLGHHQEDDGQELLAELGLPAGRRQPGRGVPQRRAGGCCSRGPSTTSCPRRSGPTAATAGSRSSSGCSTSPTTSGGTTSRPTSASRATTCSRRCCSTPATR